jgi:hypothetical protein
MGNKMNELIKLGALALVSFGAGSGGVSALYYYRPDLTPGTHTVVMAPAVVRDVPWFKAHRADLQAKYVDCHNNPGLGALDPECTNAEYAKQSADEEDAIARYDAAK